MSALVFLFAVGLAQPDPAAVAYCESRVASLPAAAREEAQARCGAVVSEFLRARDRVEALKRLAQLEAWLRLREDPIAVPTVSDCKQEVEAKDVELQRQASERLARGRQSLRQPRESDSGRRPDRPRDGGLLDPF